MDRREAYYVDILQAIEDHFVWPIIQDHLPVLKEVVNGIPGPDHEHLR
jgi:hypothetical protein